MNLATLLQRQRVCTSAQDPALASWRLVIPGRQISRLIPVE